MHGITCSHILVVGLYKVVLDELDSMDCQRIGVVAVCGRNIRLDGMCHRIHTCMSDELLRHGLCKLRIDDRNIRCDLEVSDRVLGALLIIRDN